MLEYSGKTCRGERPDGDAPRARSRSAFVARGSCWSARRAPDAQRPHAAADSRRALAQRASIRSSTRSGRASIRTRRAWSTCEFVSQYWRLPGNAGYDAYDRSHAGAARRRRRDRTRHRGIVTMEYPNTRGRGWDHSIGTLAIVARRPAGRGRAVAREGAAGALHQFVLDARPAASSRRSSTSAAAIATRTTPART